ncbi:hypothetical protein ACFLVG_05245, partial [Chloroflexota bacterium]
TGGAEEAEVKAELETKETGGAEFYEGEVKLSIVSPVDFRQIRKLQEYLSQVQGLRLVSVSGSVDRGSWIVVSAPKPLPLIDILREIPPVGQVVKEGADIQVTLKAE